MFCTCLYAQSVKHLETIRCVEIKLATKNYVYKPLKQLFTDQGPNVTMIKRYMDFVRDVRKRRGGFLMSLFVLDQSMNAAQRRRRMHFGYRD